MATPRILPDPAQLRDEELFDAVKHHPYRLLDSRPHCMPQVTMTPGINGQDLFFVGPLEIFCRYSTRLNNPVNGVNYMLCERRHRFADASAVRKHYVTSHAPAAGAHINTFLAPPMPMRMNDVASLRTQLADFNAAWRVIEREDPARAACPRVPLSHIHHASAFELCNNQVVHPLEDSMVAWLERCEQVAINLETEAAALEAEVRRRELALGIRETR